MGKEDLEKSLSESVKGIMESEEGSGEKPEQSKPSREETLKRLAETTERLKNLRESRESRDIAKTVSKNSTRGSDKSKTALPKTQDTKENTQKKASFEARKAMMKRGDGIVEPDSGMVESGKRGIESGKGTIESGKPNTESAKHGIESGKPRLEVRRSDNESGKPNTESAKHGIGSGKPRLEVRRSDNESGKSTAESDKGEKVTSRTVTESNKLVAMDKKSPVTEGGNTKSLVKPVVASDKPAESSSKDESTSKIVNESESIKTMGEKGESHKDGESTSGSATTEGSETAIDSDKKERKRFSKWYYVDRGITYLVTAPYNLVCLALRGAYACINFLLVIAVLLGIGGTIIFAKVRPMYDEASEQAYEKLATLKDGKFHMLSNTRIYDRNGKKIGEIDAGDYVYVDITDTSEWLQKGYIAVEDKRFTEHAGVDLQSITRAFLALIKHNGGITQGGSTITQQLIKNTLLTQEQTMSRKLVEVLIAPRIEQRYSKDKIMEFYLNTCYYGNLCYGVETASRYYFGKKSKDLNIAEAAMLCGISNSPNNYNPVASEKLARKRQKTVLKEMLKVGYITAKQYKKEVKRKLKIKVNNGTSTNENYMVSYALHCTAIELMKRDNFPFKYVFKNKADETAYNKKYSQAYKVKSALIRSGGYKIYTTFDLSIQKKLQETIDKDLGVYKEKQKNKKYALQGASVCIDNETGYVVAIVGGRGSKDEFNRAFLAKRQPGSTIKPLLDYAPAINEGIVNPSTHIVDGEVYDKTGTYSPKNSGGHYYGDVTLREALARSLNTVAFQLYKNTGYKKSISYLEKLQVSSLSYADNHAPSLSLGGFTYGAKVVEMARGYNTLAMGGQYTSRTCLTKISHEIDGVLYSEIELSKSQSQVYSTDTAFMVTDMLQGGIEKDYGTGKSIRNSRMILAGKTGTTSNNKDAWFCGYTKYYTTAVWVGYDTPRVMDGMYGGTVPARVFSDFMVKLSENLTKADFTVPETIGLCRVKSGYYIGGSTTFEQNPNKREWKSRPKGYEWYSEQNKKQYETYQKDTILEGEIETAKNALNEFLDFNIYSVDDCFVLDKRYADCLNSIGGISDEYKQTNLKKKAADHYIKLTEIVNTEWQTAITEYKAEQKRKKKEQRELAYDDSVNSAKAKLKQDRLTTADWYLSMMGSRNYYSDVTKKLIKDAKVSIDRLEGYSEYDSYMTRYKQQKSRCEGLPLPPVDPAYPRDDEDDAYHSSSEYPEQTPRPASTPKPTKKPKPTPEPDDEDDVIDLE